MSEHLVAVRWKTVCHNCGFEHHIVRNMKRGVSGDIPPLPVGCSDCRTEFEGNRHAYHRTMTIEEVSEVD